MYINLCVRKIKKNPMKMCELLVLNFYNAVTVYCNNAVTKKCNYEFY